MARGRKRASKEYRSAKGTVIFNKIKPWVESGDTIREACKRIRLSATVVYKFLDEDQKQYLKQEKKKWSSAVLRFKS